MKLHYAIVYLYPSYLYSYTPLLDRRNTDLHITGTTVHSQRDTGDGLNPLERLAEDCPKTSPT